MNYYISTLLYTNAEFTNGSTYALNIGIKYLRSSCSNEDLEVTWLTMIKY